MSPRIAAALDWAFRDRRTGRRVIAQAPNLPLWLFIALTGLALAADRLGGPAGWARVGAGLALAWWGLDEILRGVNPWRRFLGAAVLLAYAVLHVPGAGGR